MYTVLVHPGTTTPGTPLLPRLVRRQLPDMLCHEVKLVVGLYNESQVYSPENDLSLTPTIYPLAHVLAVHHRLSRPL